MPIWSLGAKTSEQNHNTCQFGSSGQKPEFRTNYGIHLLCIMVCIGMYQYVFRMYLHVLWYILACIVLVLTSTQMQYMLI